MISHQQWSRKAQPVVTLTLPYPPSQNHIWKRGRTGMYRAPRYMSWLTAAGYALSAQHPGCIRGDYRIKITLGRPDKRRRDLDNTEKVVSDLLVRHGVIEDDSKAVQISLAWSDRIEGCRVSLKAVNPIREAA
jgi:crossover junction endodeoxyribonuclease RusA